MTTLDDILGPQWDEITLPHRDGREIMVYPLTYGRARIGISQPGAQTYDDVF